MAFDNPIMLTVSISSSSFFSTYTYSWFNRDFYWSSFTFFCSVSSLSWRLLISLSKFLCLASCFSLSSWYPLSMRSSCCNSLYNLTYSSLVNSLDWNACCLTSILAYTFSCCLSVAISSSSSLTLLPESLPTLSALFSASIFATFFW